MKRFAALGAGFVLAILGVVGSPNSAEAIVGGALDCAVNQLGTPGSGCAHPTVGVLAFKDVPPNLRFRCSDRLISNGPDKAVILTAAHCVAGPDGVFDPQRGDGISFDSKVEDDSVTPHIRTALTPDRVVVPDAVLIHPLIQPLHPIIDVSRKDVGVTRDLTLIVIDDPAKLTRLNELWHLPQGRLVALPAPGYFDGFDHAGLASLPIKNVAYGNDWATDSPSGGYGGYGNTGYRQVGSISVDSLNPIALKAHQNQNSGLQGQCGGDSGSSAFLDNGAATPTIVAMPVFFDGSKCQATAWWLRFDVPDALNFINCGFATGSAEAVKTCLKNAF